MRARKPMGLDENTEYDMFVAGVSLVIHPHNPMAPTFHANYRFVFSFLNTHCFSNNLVFYALLDTLNFGKRAEMSHSLLQLPGSAEGAILHHRTCLKRMPSTFTRQSKAFAINTTCPTTPDLKNGVMNISKTSTGVKLEELAEYSLMIWRREICMTLLTLFLIVEMH
jgi:hypothetical protein